MASEETQVQTRSRAKFEKTVKEIHDRASGQILDLVDVSLGDEGKFKAIRSKILRVVNDAGRKFQKELEQHYRMEYVSTVDDVIVFGHGNSARTNNS
jgi:hypothetical protein